jgi:hypothetical protein
MTTWRKSSYSGSQADCVEVGGDSSEITIRDTKNRGNGSVLRLTPSDWARFTTSIKR